MSKRQRPLIGVFDSGIGGLTVLESLCEALPEADYLYFGDNANLPYGTKSPTQVKQLSVKAAKWFKTKKVDALVVACNTASSLALPEMRQKLGSTPVFGVVEPAADEALRSARSRHVRKILILATSGTVRSQAYLECLRQKNRGKQKITALEVIQKPCPLLVPLIEEGIVRGSLLRGALRHYLKPLGSTLESGGVVILGCTHYPWIEKEILSALGGLTKSGQWITVSSGFSLSNRLKNKRKLWANRDLTSERGRNQTFIQFKFSDPEALPQFAKAHLSALFSSLVLEF